MLKKTVLIKLDNSDADRYKNLLLVYSNEDKESVLHIPGEYDVLLDPECSDRLDNPERIKDSITLSGPMVFLLAY